MNYFLTRLFNYILILLHLSTLFLYIFSNLGFYNLCFTKLCRTNSLFLLSFSGVTYYLLLQIFLFIFKTSNNHFHFCFISYALICIFYALVNNSLFSLVNI